MGCGSRKKPARAGWWRNLLLNQMDDVVLVERDEDTHVLNRAGVVGSGERGGNVEVRICATVGFHTQLIQSNNVVTANL